MADDPSDPPHADTPPVAGAPLWFKVFGVIAVVVVLLLVILLVAGGGGHGPGRHTGGARSGATRPSSVTP